MYVNHNIYHTCHYNKLIKTNSNQYPGTYTIGLQAGIFLQICFFPWMTFCSYRVFFSHKQPNCHFFMVTWTKTQIFLPRYLFLWVIPTICPYCSSSYRFPEKHFFVKNDQIEGCFWYKWVVFFTKTTESTLFHSIKYVTWVIPKFCPFHL